MDTASSGVGVLDKAAAVLSALEAGPATLASLVSATGLARPTAHRLAVALEHHRLVSRDIQGRFVLGPRLSELAVAAGEDRLLAAAGPVLANLRDVSGESAQLYRRQGEMRVCVAAAERLTGLRDTVPVGVALPMAAGSGAQVLGPVVVGRRSRIGANAVVTKDVPEGAVMVGIPARATMVEGGRVERSFVPYGTPCSEMFDPATQQVELMRCELETLRKRLDALLAEQEDRRDRA